MSTDAAALADGEARKRASIEVLVRGRVDRTPQNRLAKNGNPFVSFSLAVDVGGRTEWITVNVFDRLDEMPPLKEGQLVQVAGRLRVNRWRTETGANAFGLNVTADNIITDGDA